MLSYLGYIAAEYRTTLPDEETLAAELDRTRQTIEGRAATKTARKLASIGIRS